MAFLNISNSSSSNISSKKSIKQREKILVETQKKHYKVNLNEVDCCFQLSYCFSNCKKP